MGQGCQEHGSIYKWRVCGVCCHSAERPIAWRLVASASSTGTSQSLSYLCQHCLGLCQTYRHQEARTALQPGHEVDALCTHTVTLLHRMQQSTEIMIGPIPHHVTPYILNTRSAQAATLGTNVLDWGLLISGVPLVIASRAANIFPVAAVVNKGVLLALHTCMKRRMLQSVCHNGS